MNKLMPIEQNDNKEHPVLCVIVTIYGGSSYDNLFRSVPQKAPDGRVILYALDPTYLKYLLNFLKGITNDIQDNVLDKRIAQLKIELSEVNPDSVLFNFECDSVCIGNGSHFTDKKTVNEFIKHSLDMGYMVMFSCYSSASLINDWDEKIIGNNPFLHCGNCAGQMALVFEKEPLANCESKQLQMVAELSQTNRITVDASGAPIIGINYIKTDTSDYILQILTVADNTSNLLPQDKNCSAYIGSTNGCVGHTILKFKSGGIMIISAGHWIQLKNISIDIKTLEKVAQEKYGNDYMNEINDIKNCSLNDKPIQFMGDNSDYNQRCNDEEMEFKEVKCKENIKNFKNSKKTRKEESQNELMNNMAKKFIQQTAPCNYTKK